MSQRHNHVCAEMSGSLGFASSLWYSVWRYWDAGIYVLGSSDGRHKPVHIPRICRVSQITPSVANRTCSTVILGEWPQLHWGDPAIMVHRLCMSVTWGMDTSCPCIPLGVTLSIWTLVWMVVWVAVWPGVGEPGMRGWAGWYSSSAWLTWESRGSHSAGTGSFRTEGPAGLLHHLWPLWPQHAGWSWVSHEVIDAEHAGLTWSKPRRWWGRIVGGWQLLPVGWTDCHVGVDWVGICGRSGNLDRGENWSLMHVWGIGAQVTALEPLPPPQEAAAFEHVLCIWV